MEEVDHTKAVKVSIILIAAVLELLLFMLIAFVNIKFFRAGSEFFYFAIWGTMIWFWGTLPQGRLKKKWQIILFSIVPFSIFFIFQLLHLNNWIGFFVFILYFVIVGGIFDINPNDGSSAGGGSGFRNKIVKSAIKGLLK